MATEATSTSRVEGRRLLELSALTGLALVQPVLDVLGRSPETFVHRGVGGWRLVLFAVAVAVVPALVLWGLGLSTRLLGERIRRAVHHLTLGGLTAAAVLVALKSAGWLFGPVALAVAALAAATGIACYLRFTGVRLFLGYLSVMPLLSAAAFLFIAPVSALVGDTQYDLVADPGTATPLVVLVLDEFPTTTVLDRAGRVDAERYPNLARLSRDARWFRNYTTVNNLTIHAVPAMLTGKAPEADDVPLLGDHRQNLFTFLGRSHRLNVSEAVTQLCPAPLCPHATAVEGRSGLRGSASDARDVLRELVSLEAFPGPESDFFVEEVTRPSDVTFDRDEDAATQPTRFRDFLDGMASDGGPALHYLHMVMPHEPWRFFPDGTEYVAPTRDPRGDPDGRWVGEWPARLARFRFEMQARYTDGLLGQMVDRLEQTGLWDEAVVVVVGDHGGGFTEGEGRRILTEGNVVETLWSTLFVRAPGLEPGISDVNITALDLLPTVADLLGTEVPWATDGSSVLAADDGSAAAAGGEKVFHRFTDRYSDDPPAVLRFDSAAHLEQLLTERWPRFATADPVADLYRGTPHDRLYGRAVEDLAVGDPVEGAATVDDLERIEGGSRPELAAYVGGRIDGVDLDEGAWVVVVADGVVGGLSSVFAEEEGDQGFAVLLDPAGVDPDGVALELFVIDRRGGPLRPLAVVGG